MVILESILIDRTVVVGIDIQISPSSSLPGLLLRLGLIIILVFLRPGRSKSLSQASSCILVRLFASLARVVEEITTCSLHVAPIEETFGTPSKIVQMGWFGATVSEEEPKAVDPKTDDYRDCQD